MKEGLTCQEASALVTEAMEGALDGARLARFDEHVGRCEPCAVFYAQMQATVAVLEAMPRDEAVPSDALLDTLERHMPRR
jgi:hypothetical protein